MAQGLELNIPDLVVTNPNLPYDFLDDTMSIGTEFMFDFSRTECWANQAAQVAAGSVAKNMVLGAADGTFAGVSVTYANGAIKLPGLSLSVLNLGNNFNLGSFNAIRYIWIKLNDDFDTTSAYARIFGKYTTTQIGNVQFFIDAGNKDLLKPRGGIGTATESPVRVANNAITKGTWVLFGVAYENKRVKFFINGVLDSQSATDTEPPLLATTTDLRVGGDTTSKFTFSRLAGENLTLSGRTAAQVMALEYASQAARHGLPVA